MGAASRGPRAPPARRRGRSPRSPPSLATVPKFRAEKGYNARMDDEAAFDERARDELAHIEDAFADVDPDQVDVSASDGVLKLDLRDGTKIVINSHRAARQIWMAAVASAWHFDPGSDGRWHAAKTGDELRATLVRVVQERIGLAVRI